jgi:parallel beta-helix repeat protein
MLNGKQIYYYVNENGITVPSDANQLIFVNCSNIDIEDITFENVINGIQLNFCSKITINDNDFFTNEKNSIDTYHCNNITIENNNIDFGNGINFLDTEDCVINQNTITNTETAINLDNSNNNIVSRNSISKNEKGIYSTYGSDNDINNNDIFENSDYGIYLISNSNYNTITRNDLYENRITIRIKGSKNNDVFINNLRDSSEKGIYICCGATQNSVYRNSFINNKRHVDFTILNVNFFHKDGFGNYWDDYIESYPNANQNNGIWDTPYEIPETNSIDEYPLVDPIQL